MRRGRIVADGNGMSAAELAAAMVDARAANAGSPPASRAKAAADDVLRHRELSVRRGEIVAIIGVAGNGQTELANTLRATLRQRAAHIPEDRTRDGIVAEMTIAENIALADRRWHPRAARERAQSLIERYAIRAQSPLQRAGSLSGGNQQKVILARELGREPDVIVAAEPTRGLDLDSTRFVREELRAAAGRGAGVLLITSDLDEAFELGDAVHVIYRGALSARLTPSEAAVQAPLLMAGVA